SASYVRRHRRRETSWTQSSGEKRKMPDRSTLKRALGLIKRRADYEYFFSRLTTPDWIVPILEEGLFDQPPIAVRQGEYIQFPFWPESEYLARVADQAPKLAADALRRIPLNDNLRVNHDLVEIALKVPVADAAAWTEAESRWLEEQQWFSLFVPD